MNGTPEQIKHFWDGIERGEGCWNWLRGLTADGYGAVGFNYKTIKASRLALLLSKGEPPADKPYALHTCKENRKCCNPDHLYWGDQSDNMRDRVKDNTLFQMGENAPSAKLTSEKVLEIREKYSNGGFSYNKLASEYEMGKTQIARIIKRECWTHI